MNLCSQITQPFLVPDGFVTTFYRFVVSSIVITSLGEERVGRFSSLLLWHISWFHVIPLFLFGARGGLRSLILALPTDLFIVSSIKAVSVVYALCKRSNTITVSGKCVQWSQG